VVTIEQREHVLSWLERAVILVSMLYLAAHTLPAAWKTLNTDFPNYYMSAQLVHDGYDPARMYDWSWIEREKDHRALDIRVIGLLPIMPFSTLAMLPIARLAPLAAKHVWILLSLTSLIPIVWMLRSMTGLSYQRIVLVFALCFPLHRNLEFGQYYIVLLLLIVAACWSYLRGWHAMAGVLVAIAAACKVFPILFLLFFLRRRAWRALSWTLATGLVIATLSIAVFGWDVHRTYLQEILPWTLHGEAMPPYVASASISGVLHRLFLSEPQWNPHPWHNSPLWFALLMPSLQMIALAPAILLVRRGDVSRTRTLLEWSAILTASLATSTVPALYNFVLMTLPVCVLAAALLEARRYRWILPLLIVFLCIGLPLPSAEKLSGAWALLQVARLPLILVLLAGLYWLLWNDPANEGIERDSTTYVWAVAISITVVVSVFSTFYRERSMRLEYAYRLPLQEQGFLNAHPHPAGSGVRYIAFSYTGYHLVIEDQNKIQTAALTELPDDLSFTNVRDTNGEETIYAERAVSPRSQIVDISHGSQVVVEDAREPMLSADGKDLAFIRDDHGRGRLVERPAFAEAGSRERPLTLSLWNVYEASFRSDREYAFSAVSNGRAPEVYLTDATHTNSPLNLGESRYPAISPDGRWMAYSKFEGNGWNLWLRDQRIGTTRRIADVPCNQIQPMWEEDSRALLYSTDCGRSLWFTAIARRTVVP
jgi:hypothetical protein